MLAGKTTTTEFTVPNSGPQTANPHDPSRTPGGSSCGSAAAVADFQVPLALGTQTGGSVIRPASYTGVFAMKPSHDAISLEGVKPVSPTFDTLGFFARSTDDLKLLADVFGLGDDDPPAVSDPESPSAISEAPQAMSVALVTPPSWDRAGPCTVAAMSKAARALESHGLGVTTLDLETVLGQKSEILKRWQSVIINSEAQVSFLGEYRTDQNKLSPEICELVENRAGYTHAERLRAQEGFVALRAKADELAGKYAVIIAPSALDEAPLGLGDMGSPAFNTIWTGLHMPAVNVPAFVGEHGMPVGLSLVAGRYRDQHLLRVGKVVAEVLLGAGKE